jgi:hypothetical protein
MFLSVEQFSSQTAAERHLEAFVLKLNKENPTLAILEPTFDAVLDRFIEEECLLEIKKVRPGERTEGIGELSYSTASSYLAPTAKRNVRSLGPMSLTPAQSFGVSSNGLSLTRYESPSTRMYAATASCSAASLTAESGTVG